MLSTYIIAVIAAWLIAQGSKYLVSVVRNRDLGQVKRLYMSGGMPSAHSASVVAVLTVVACLDGVNSALFGVTLLLGSIVLYDAVMVRRSSGEQGEALQRVLKKIGDDGEKPMIAKGHTPLEVVVGGLLGLVIGLAVIWLN